MNAQQKQQAAAYHEAGHVVVALALGGDVRSVLIRSDGTGENESRFLDDGLSPAPWEVERYTPHLLDPAQSEQKLRKCRRLWKTAIRKSAGWTSEKRAGFPPDQGAEVEKAQCEATLQAMLREGLSIAKDTLRQVTLYRCEDLVSRNWKAIDTLAAALLKYGTLTTAQISALVPPGTLQA